MVQRARPTQEVGGKYEIDALTLLTAKMDAMTQKLDKWNVQAVNSCAPSPLCDKCGSLDHVYENCQVGNPFALPHVDHVANVNNFQPRPNSDPYSNSYNPSWKQYPNFSYRIDPLSFPRPMLGLHLDFKDHPFHYRLHHLKSLTWSPC